MIKRIYVTATKKDIGRTVGDLFFEQIDNAELERHGYFASWVSGKLKSRLKNEDIDHAYIKPEDFKSVDIITKPGKRLVKLIKRN